MMRKKYSLQQQHYNNTRTAGGINFFWLSSSRVLNNTGGHFILIANEPKHIAISN
jgi:hypothetical protein